MKILNTQKCKAGQSDEFTSIVTLTNAKTTSISYKVRVVIHRDKSYDNQSRAQAEIFTDRGWANLAYLPYPLMKNDDSDFAELIRLSNLVLGSK